jgi:hypothetical protein
MDLIISRDYRPEETRGTIFVMEKGRILFNCLSLELPEKGNQQNVSCCLPGKYPAKKVKNEKGKIVFLLFNVPGRTGIEMHPGNFAAGLKVDTKGCILPGIRYTDINGDGYIDITDTTIAMDILISLLPEEFTIYIL